MIPTGCVSCGSSLMAVLLLSARVSAQQRPTDLVPVEGAPAEARLLHRDEAHSIHVLLTRQATHVLRTDRKTGAMQVLHSSGIAQLPTRGRKIRSAFVLGALVQGGELYLCTWTMIGSSRTAPDQLRDREISDKEHFRLLCFDLATGKQRANLQVPPDQDWLAGHGRKGLKAIHAAALAGPIEVVDGAIHVFGTRRRIR